MMNNIYDYLNSISPFTLKTKTEDEILIDNIVKDLKSSGFKDDDITYMVIDKLKDIGRYDLLTPCERGDNN